jgi:large subunit ribosomal protein L5
MSNLFKYYQDVVRPLLILKYNYCKVKEVPEVKKAEVRVFLRNLSGEEDWRAGLALKLLTLLTGQKSGVRRMGWSVESGRERRYVFSCGVTLRNKNLYDFLEYLVIVVLPLYYRRYGYPQFSGSSTGVYSLSIKDLGLFYRQSEDVIGFDGAIQISIVSNAMGEGECLTLMEGLGLPVKGKPSKKL